MTVRRRAAAVVTLTALTLGLSACGDEDSTANDAASSTPAASEVEVSNGWVRATEGSEDPSMSAAFMDLRNDGAEVSLTGASTEVATMTQIHEMVEGEDGAMVMQELSEGLPLAAGSHAHLEPGGNHVMLMGLTTDLAAGDEVDLTLEFSDGSEQDLTLPVKKFTEEEGHYHTDKESPSPSGSSSPSGSGSPSDSASPSS